MDRFALIDKGRKEIKHTERKNQGTLNIVIDCAYGWISHGQKFFERHCFKS